MAKADVTTVEIDGQQVRLSNIDKALYPSGFTKGEVIHYYISIAPALLPHVEDRPATFVRFPDGVGSESFFTKNAPRGTPDWVRTETLPAPGSQKNRSTIDYVVLDSVASLAWAANLAALELHVPQWCAVGDGTAAEPDLIVVDLDPGPPATIVECCQVAQLVREMLGPTAVAKTSGSKGMQVYAQWDGGDSRGAMKKIAQDLEKENPALVVSRMTKSLREGKVLLDWSQNHTAKTTIAPYSLRGRDRPTVSTPITWDEVAACRDPADLVFVADDVLARVDEFGDLFAPLVRT
jgi:bifunctional non-homologous end joining protein LigD